MLSESFGSPGGALFEKFPRAMRLLTGKYMQDIQGGAFPYLFGGIRKPECSMCSASGDIADFCHFRKPVKDRSTPFQHTAHLCGLSKTVEAIHYFQQSGLYDLLQMTPCDLWPYIKHRKLWVIGDSQASPETDAHGCELRPTKRFP
jgi:hypothetical protein